MVSVEFGAGAVGLNCSWWADGRACMVASPSGTLVGVFDLGVGLSIGGFPSVTIHKPAPTGTQPLMSWHGAVPFGLAEPFGAVVAAGSGSSPFESFQRDCLYSPDLGGFQRQPTSRFNSGRLVAAGLPLNL